MEVAVGIYVDHKKNELEKTNVKSLPKEKNVEKNQKRCHVWPKFTKELVKTFTTIPS